jgi:hypothetical protein
MPKSKDGRMQIFEEGVKRGQGQEIDERSEKQCQDVTPGWELTNGSGCSVESRAGGASAAAGGGGRRRREPPSARKPWREPRGADPLLGLVHGLFQGLQRAQPRVSSHKHNSNWSSNQLYK